MKQDFDERHYFAGYPGHDSMRNKARALMEQEMMGTKMTNPGGMMEPGREKMRLYKEGGHVKHHHKHHAHHSHEHAMHKIKGGLIHEPHSYEHEEIHPFHGHKGHHGSHPHGYSHGGHSHERGPGYKHGGNVEKKRAHLHKEQREGLHETERALKKESHLKHGGHHKHHMHEGGRPHSESEERSHGYKKGGHHKHHSDGGVHHQSDLFPMHRHEESGMKRTGNGHHPETHQRRHTSKNIEGGSLTNLHVPTPKLNVESIREMEKMRKGGHMHKKHHSHVKKFAAGGTVYEHEMVGEKPGSHKHVNYEKDMKGMHPSRVPHMTGTTRKNPGACDESFGTVFKRGGKASKGGKFATGGKVKLAAGGAGKIRHGVADKFGRPKMAKRVMGY